MTEKTNFGPKPFEKFEKSYTNFKRPPLAKVYHPTSEEFSNPIAYVAQIKPEAEKYGVVKIIPPKDFKPSFAIDKDTFTFTPRVQKLSEIEAIVRERNAFIERITQYWELQGEVLKIPQVENRPLDIFKAMILIRLEGGFNAVCINKKWTTIAKWIGLKTNQAGSKLKEHYAKLVLPYTENIEEREEGVKVEDEEDDKKDVKEEGNRGLGEGRSTMQGGNRKGKMSGKKDSDYKDEGKRRPCDRCTRTEESLPSVKCVNCLNGRHLCCMLPPMNERPKKEWHCVSCTESRMRGWIGEEQGFMDSATSYTLHSFSLYAQEYKRIKFGKEPEEVTLDEMEEMYWRNMWTGDSDLQVKYGADLTVSKVGSGFPRKSDPNMSEEDRRIAHHPWNLNNMPVVTDSVLSHIDSSISGMMVPWVYVGMGFSTFCWHTEDHWTYSVNYNHWGEPKIWYGVGADQATKFEEAVQSMCPSLFRRHSDLLHHMTVAVNPHFLRSMGVDVYTVHQNPGEFVITFPRAYHSGFNQGLNFAEAVNFAPVDWLSMGRDCMESYGRVKRDCVFAHDELVMKMARAAERLSTPMALAALHELTIIHSREVAERSRIEELGVRKRARLDFETIEEDDEKMCKFCKTTLFMSGLRCEHGKCVCLHHLSHLCNKCTLDHIQLLFSYEVEELVPMMKRLKDRMKRQADWEERARRMMRAIKSGQGPEWSEVEELLGEGREGHYALSVAHAYLLDEMTDMRPLFAKATALFSGVRVRSRTRLQRADTRLDLNEVMELEKELAILPVKATLLHEKIKEVIDRGIEWNGRVERAMGGEEVDEKLVETLIEEAETTLGMMRNDMLGALHLKERRSKWLESGVRELAEWNIMKCDEASGDWMSSKRWSFEQVNQMVDEGRRVGMGASLLMRKIDEKKAAAGMIDQMARQVMERNSCVGHEERRALEETWRKTREVDWLDAPGMNCLREEMHHLYCVYSYKNASQFSLFDYVEWIGHLEGSKTLGDEDNVENPAEQLRALKEWTDRVRGEFELTHSYHSLYESLVCRENVMALAEGQRPILRRERETSSLAIWKPVHTFSSYQSMIEMLEGVFRRFPSDMDHLRWSHECLPAAKTCPCLSEKDGQPLLVCLVCKAKTHLECAWWNEYLDGLPPGSFLCVRCLRSRRPPMQRVKDAMHIANLQWMEAHVLQFAIQRFEDTREDVEKWNSLWSGDRENTEKRKGLTQSIITLLSLEMTDPSLLALLAIPISTLFRSTLESQKEACNKLRSSSSVSALLGESLFMNKRRGNPIYALSPLSSPIPKRKREEKEGGEAKEILCAHADCLLPLTSQLQWVKCEVCKRHYHLICTGLVIDPDLSDYKCCDL